MHPNFELHRYNLLVVINDTLPNISIRVQAEY